MELVEFIKRRPNTSSDIEHATENIREVFAPAEFRAAQFRDVSLFALQRPDSHRRDYAPFAATTDERLYGRSCGQGDCQDVF